MSARRFMLGIETSNPSACASAVLPARKIARRVQLPEVLMGAGVALAEFDVRGVDCSQPGWRSAAACEIVGSEPVGPSGRHSDDLMPAIDRVCTKAGVSRDQLGSVAVSIGPGSYTGLRVAVVTAKALAEALGAEVFSVPSWKVAAWDVAPAEGSVLVCLASKRDAAHAVFIPCGVGPRKPWWARVEPILRTRHDDTELARIHERGVRDAKDWIAGAVPLGVMDASIIEPLGVRRIVGDEHLPQEFRVEADRLAIDVRPPRLAAAHVIGIARDMDPIPHDTLAPIYAREPDAVTQWRARHGGDSGGS